MVLPHKSTIVFFVVLSLAVLGVYAPGLQNELLFDDLRLSDGTIFGEYGGFTQIKQRMLSYGSFVWVNAILGDGWWKQRIINVVLHIGTVVVLYNFLAELLCRTEFPEDIREQPHFESSQRAALHVAVALFALHPIAVYAVGYLIQRSIVMATMLSLASCWLFITAVRLGASLRYLAALVCYCGAVLAKEHAIMTAALAIPLYIHVRRPPWYVIAKIIAFALGALAVATAALLQVYGNVLGAAFDPRSVAFVKQLETLQPGISGIIFPLSIFNEAALFFKYGALWLVPYTGWLSVDLRPEFPLNFLAFPQIAGAASYVLLLWFAVFLLFRFKGIVSLAAVLLLFPTLWYATEFVTVWIQDPFVLYRSYLWAIALPGLAAIILTGFRPRTLYAVGAVIGLLLGGLALERVLSLQDEGTAWSDAAEKIQQTAPANALGRSRPFLNLGAYQLERGAFAQAERNFLIADALGDIGGNARFNLGVALQQQRKHLEAFEAFANAESKGYYGQSLYYHWAETSFALGRFSQAHDLYSKALSIPSDAMTPDARMQRLMQLRRAEAAIGANRFDAALTDFTELLALKPQDPRLLVGMGMALIGKGQYDQAIEKFDTALRSGPSAPALYGRGIAWQRKGRVDRALEDMEAAVRLEPRSSQYRQMRDQIARSAKR